jgi:hypothetical protein
MNMYEIGGRSSQLLLAVRRQNDIFSVYARTEIIIDSCIELIHFKHGDIAKKEIIMQHAGTTILPTWTFLYLGTSARSERGL